LKIEFSSLAELFFIFKDSVAGQVMLDTNLTLLP